MATLAPTQSRPRLAKLAIAGILLLAPSGNLLPAQTPNPDLYNQAIAVMLNRNFPSPRIEYLLLYPVDPLDPIALHTRQTVALRWNHPERPIPAGSLLKPFVALAYSQLAQPLAPTPAKFPILQCHGKRDGCWRPGGHGSLTLERALAVSCNAYFLTLARELVSAGNPGAEALNRVGVAYNLPPPPNTAIAATLIGLTPDWRIPPLALAEAYAQLALGSAPVQEQTTVTQLLHGMKLATQPGGTAQRIAVSIPGGVLAKTGTAPCLPSPQNGPCIANGDGLAIVLTPARIGNAPRLLLLVRQRGTTGAQTAELAGRMLAAIARQPETQHGSR